MINYIEIKMQYLINELKKICYLSGQIALNYKDNGLIIECKDAVTFGNVFPAEMTVTIMGMKK